MDLEKVEEPEIKLPTSIESWKKQENSIKTSTSASLTTLMPLTVWNTTVENWKILKVIGIADHIACLLRNLYAGPEATIRTEHVTMDWFKIGERVHQSCILLLCLFNLYAKYKLPDAQVSFRKGRGTRYQIASICWIIEKAREFHKNIYFCFIDYTKAVVTVWITTYCGKFLQKCYYQTTLPASGETCMQIKKQQLELDMEQQTGFK